MIRIFEELIQKRNDEEIERKNNLSSNNNWINAFIIFSISIISTTFSKFVRIFSIAINKFTADYLNFIKNIFRNLNESAYFLILFIFTIISYIILFYFVFKYYKGENYKYIDTLSKINEYSNRLRIWCEENGKDYELLFKNDLNSELIKIVDNNFNSNNKKSFNLTKIRICILGSTILLVIMMILSNLIK